MAAMGVCIVVCGVCYRAVFDMRDGDSGERETRADRKCFDDCVRDEAKGCRAQEKGRTELFDC